MKRYQKKILPALLGTALLCGSVLAPQALAMETGYETYNETYYETDNTTTQEQTDPNTVTDSNGNAVVLDDPNQVVSQYNLASENWDDLLGVTDISSEAPASENTASQTEDSATSQSEETASQGGILGNFITHSSSGGTSILMIGAIAAFALGAFGIIFFLYSQFIYKAKLRRKIAAEEELELGDDLPEGWESPDDTELQRPHHPVPHTPPAVEKPAPEQSAPAEPTSTLSQEDQKRLDEIDWDAILNKDNQKK